MQLSEILFVLTDIDTEFIDNEQLKQNCNQLKSAKIPKEIESINDKLPHTSQELVELII